MEQRHTEFLEKMDMHNPRDVYRAMQIIVDELGRLSARVNAAEVNLGNLDGRLSTHIQQKPKTVKGVALGFLSALKGSFR